MKTRSKNSYLARKVLVILTCLFTTSAIASFTGTYAWFEYQTRAQASLSGVVFGEMDDIVIGLNSKVDLPKANEYGLDQDETYPNYYWAHNNELTDKAITYFCSLNDLYFGSLEPVTSGPYKLGEKLSLKKSPSYLRNYSKDDLADSNSYIHLPLVFHVNQEIGDYTKGIGIYPDVEFVYSSGLEQSIRVYYESQLGNFLFCPQYVDDGRTLVGGILDLDADGYYDIKDGKEFCYGDAIDIKYQDKPYDHSKFLKPPFKAEHKKGVQHIDSYNSTFAEAAHYGYTTMKKTAVTRTFDDSKNCECDFYVFFEGWETGSGDKDIVDKEHRMTFSFRAGL